MCEVRAGLREEDAHILTLMLEPFEFIQPGPETPSSPVAGVPRHMAEDER